MANITVLVTVVPCANSQEPVCLARRNRRRSNISRFLTVPFSLASLTPSWVVLLSCLTSLSSWRWLMVCSMSYFCAYITQFLFSEYWKIQWNTTLSEWLFLVHCLRKKSIWCHFDWIKLFLIDFRKIGLYFGGLFNFTIPQAFMNKKLLRSLTGRPHKQFRRWKICIIQKGKAITWFILESSWWLGAGVWSPNKII